MVCEDQRVFEAADLPRHLEDRVELHSQCHLSPFLRDILESIGERLARLKSPMEVSHEKSEENSNSEEQKVQATMEPNIRKKLSEANLTNSVSGKAPASKKSNHGLRQYGSNFGNPEGLSRRHLGRSRNPDFDSMDHLPAPSSTTATSGDSSATATGETSTTDWAYSNHNDTEVTSSDNPMNGGLRTVEAILSKYQNENFDLKLGLHQQRKWDESLLSKLEIAEANQSKLSTSFLCAESKLKDTQSKLRGAIRERDDERNLVAHLKSEVHKLKDLVRMREAVVEEAAKVIISLRRALDPNQCGDAGPATADSRLAKVKSTETHKSSSPALRRAPSTRADLRNLHASMPPATSHCKGPPTPSHRQPLPHPALSVITELSSTADLSTAHQTRQTQPLPDAYNTHKHISGLDSIDTIASTSDLSVQSYTGTSLEAHQASPLTDSNLTAYTDINNTANPSTHSTNAKEYDPYLASPIHSTSSTSSTSNEMLDVLASLRRAGVNVDGPLPSLPDGEATNANGAEPYNDPAALAPRLSRLLQEALASPPLSPAISAMQTPDGYEGWPELRSFDRAEGDDHYDEGEGEDEEEGEGERGRTRRRRRFRFHFSFGLGRRRRHEDADPDADAGGVEDPDLGAEIEHAAATTRLPMLPNDDERPQSTGGKKCCRARNLGLARLRGMRLPRRLGFSFSVGVGRGGKKTGKAKKKGKGREKGKGKVRAD